MATRDDLDAVRSMPASELPHAQLAELFNRGYSGYEVPLALTEESFRRIAELYDFDLQASRVFDAGEGPVAFAMLGVRGNRGWIGGMGVVPEARGRRLGAFAMRAVLASARESGVATVDLEVLEGNERASRIYEELGFQDCRRLDTWFRGVDSERGEVSGATAATSDRDVTPARPLEVELCLERRRSAPDELPWQRGLPVLERLSDSMEALGSTGAWVLYRRLGPQVQIFDLECGAAGSLAGLGVVLRQLVRFHPDAPVMLQNLPADHPAAAAFAANGFATRWRQREMRIAW